MMMLKNLIRKINYSTSLIIILLIIYQSCASKSEIKPQASARPKITIEPLRQAYESKILTNDL